MIPAHPGHAPPTVTIAYYKFAPSPITVTEGDLVQWNWAGPDTGHSVTSDAGSGERFDSGVRNQTGVSFTYYFGKAGTYAYHCKTHDSMHGTVVVKAGPVFDRTPPRLRSLRASVSGHRARVRFRISEKASVTASVRRTGRAKVVSSAFAFVRKGPAAISVGLPGRGRFRVTLVAEDPTGNRSSASVGLRR